MWTSSPTKDFKRFRVKVLLLNRLAEMVFTF